MSTAPAAPGSSSLPPVPPRLLPVLFIGVFMAALDTAVLAPAIPVLRESFGLDIREAGLLMVAFILFSLPSTALMANLGDRHGRRPVFLASVALFAAGSLVIALAPNFAVLLAGRALQGVGGGGIIPTASAVIGDALPPAQRGRALGLIGATYGMAFVLGPPLAGLLMTVASWHWIFLLNLPIAALLLWMGARALPRRPAGLPSSPPDSPLPRLDVAGLVLVFFTLGCAVLGITRGLDEWLGRTLWPGLLGAAAVGLAALVAVERRAARRGQRPMVPLALLQQRQLAVTYLLTVGAGFGMGSVIFLTSIATLAHGVALENGGFVLLPMVLCSMLGSVGAGRLLNRLGARRVVRAGFVLLALGYGASAWPGWGLWGYLVATMPVGLGVGVVVGGALRTIAIDEAPLAQRGAAQGLVNIFTSVGTLASATLIGAVADSAGGGAHGLMLAYAGVAAAMGLMALASFALRATPAGQAPAVEAGA